jgi:tRNA(adenine34) deaminase
MTFSIRQQENGPVARPRQESREQQRLGGDESRQRRGIVPTLATAKRFPDLMATAARPAIPAEGDVRRRRGERPMSGVHDGWMRMALDEAAAAEREGNLAVGGVLVREGELLGRAHNESTTTADVTAHAEMVLVREVSRRLRVVNPRMRADSGELAGSVLYTTVEPCPMCAWAICLAGIARVVIGARHADMGVSHGGYAIERLIETTGQPLRVEAGPFKDECAALRLRATPR